MQAVLLAGGASSRFYPFTTLNHKSYVVLMGKPIIEHTILAIKNAGITDILIVTKDNYLQKILGDGSSLDISIKYVLQKESLGMGDALLQAGDNIADDFFLIHPHHVDFAPFRKIMEEKKQAKEELVLLAAETDDRTRFGVPKIVGDRVVEIVEKPEIGKEPSKLRIIGIYLLTREFLKIFKDCSKDHYNFEEALSIYAKKMSVRLAITDENDVTLKYPWDLLTIKNYLLKNQKSFISKNAVIAKSAVISEDVVIEEGVTISENAIIKGSCYIGKNAFVGTNAIIRNNTVIEKNAVVGANMEVKNSILMENSTTHSGFIGDSIVGANSKISAYVCTGNVRLDREAIKVATQQGKVDTFRKSLGMILGDSVKFGVRVSTMPGIIIGKNATIGPSTVVMKNIPENVTYYTKFQEIIEEKNGEKSHHKDMPDEKEMAVERKEKIVLFDIDYTLFNTDIFKQSNLETFGVYEEVAETLINLQKFAKLGIFSEGKLYFQKSKLINTKIYKHFEREHTHIVGNKSEVILELLKKYCDDMLFLVDDKLEVLHKAKTIDPLIFTIWVKRGIYAKNQKPIPDFHPDFMTKSLEEIVKIIKEI